MPQHRCLVYVSIKNPHNHTKYIPILRKFTGKSLSDIKESIVRGTSVISFDWDRAGSAQRENFVGILDSLINAGADLALQKNFYVERTDRKEAAPIALEALKEAVDFLDIGEYVRTPIKMKQLVRLREEELCEYALYIAPDVKCINADTMIYLDDHAHVSEADGALSEIYPPFATRNKLRMYFFGDTAASIIGNTRHQLLPKAPSVGDYVVNFNCYSENDAYFSFERIFT